MKKTLAAFALAFLGLVAYEFVKAINEMDDEQSVLDPYGFASFHKDR